MQLRALRVVAVALVAIGALLGSAGASTGITVGSAHNGTLGEILVSASGRTLYHTSSEKRGAITCTGACAVTWPPLLIPAHGKPVAGPGVSASKLGTVKRPNGQLQVTYDGLPLYLFSGDTKAGQVNGQGLGGLWHALTPSGTAVAKVVAATKTASSSGSTSSMGGGSSTSTTSSSAASSSSSSMSTTSTTSSSAASTTSGSTASAAMWCAANPSQCVDGVPVTPAG